MPTDSRPSMGIRVLSSRTPTEKRSTSVSFGILGVITTRTSRWFAPGSLVRPQVFACRTSFFHRSVQSCAEKEGGDGPNAPRTIPRMGHLHCQSASSNQKPSVTQRDLSYRGPRIAHDCHRLAPPTRKTHHARRTNGTVGGRGRTYRSAKTSGDGVELRCEPRQERYTNYFSNSEKNRGLRR